MSEKPSEIRLSILREYEVVDFLNRLSGEQLVAVTSNYDPEGGLFFYVFYRKDR